MPSCNFFCARSCAKPDILTDYDILVNHCINIKAGRYTIIIIPTETEWTLKLNTALDGWGNYGYDASKDIASVSVPTSKSNKVIENLSIALYEASANTVHLKIGWDSTIAEFPILIN